MVGRRGRNLTGSHVTNGGEKVCRATESSTKYRGGADAADRLRRNWRGVQGLGGGTK